MSALHNAICNNRLRQIRLLIKVGINVNLPDKEGRTPLMLVCFLDDERKRNSLTKLLLARGGKIDLKDSCGRSVLTYACISGNDFLVNKILEHTDMDVNGKDRDGNTCLMYAAINGHPKVILLLLEHMKAYGLNVDIRNCKGFTAYLLALKHGNIQCANILKEDGKASVNIFDLEKFWTGDKWVKSYYARRLDIESGGALSKIGGRAQSTKPGLLRREMISTPVQRSKSAPTERSKYINSGHLILQYSALNNGAKAKTSYGLGYYNQSSEKLSQRPSTYRHRGPLTSISERPVSSSSVDSLDIESNGDSRTSSEDEIEQIVKSQRPVSQKSELAMIFEQYSFNQVPVPKAASLKARLSGRKSPNIRGRRNQRKNVLTTTLRGTLKADKVFKSAAHAHDSLHA